MNKRLLLGLLLLSSLATAPAFALVLVDDGKPVASIVLPEKAAPYAEAPANLIQHCVERSSGAKLAILREGKTAPGPAIHIGSAAALAACPETAKLKTDGIIARARDGNIFITAQNSYALRIAAVRFLEEALGARWLFPGELGEIVPQHKTITVADDFNLVEEPDLESRMFSGMFGADPARWRLHLTLQFHHNLYKVIPVEKYGKTHPEYFPMIGGKRLVPFDRTYYGWQPETTNPEVVQLTIAAADKWFTDNPEEISFSLGVTDSGGESYSPESVALDRKLGPPTPTNRFYYFYNQVAEGLEKKYPNKLLGVLNYPPLHDVPTVKLHKNLLIYCWRGSDGGKRPAQWYGKWHNLAFCDWLYGCFYRMPRHYPHAYADLIRHYVKGGFRGMYAEAYPNWPMDGPKLYALSRVMWKLDTDVTAAVDEYLRLAYGPAAPPAERFFAIAEKAMERRNPPDIFSKWGRPILDDFDVWTAENMDGMEKTVKEMEESVKPQADSDFAKRVKLFRDGWDWYAIHMRMYVEARDLQNSRPSDDGSIAERLSRTERLCDMPEERDRLWDDVVSKQKNVLWGTDDYHNIIANSDPSLKTRDVVFEVLTKVGEAWASRGAPRAIAAKWAEARKAYPRLAEQILVREQIAARMKDGVNAVVNPGFETDLEGWKTWIRPGAEMVLKIDEAQAHEGKKSAYIGQGTIACYLQDVRVKPGDAFYLSCFARRATSNGTCAMKVWWKGPDGANLGLPQWERKAADLPGQWQSLQLLGPVPAKAGIAEILLLGEDHNQRDGCWFDDVTGLVVPGR